MLLIIGGGPCGLGAAWRLQELEKSDWMLLEKENYWGGLSASFVDSEGYVWDVGGHVLFSHYEYFDRVLDKVIPAETGWIHHERESWIRIADRWVPYPFQMNIHHLDESAFLKCVNGIIDVLKSGNNSDPRNFSEWIVASFGEGLAEIFLRPYNWKVWGFPLDAMSWKWVGERVAPVNLSRIIENYVYKRDDVAWGPNNKFRFPLRGGTGAIWKSVAASLPSDKLVLSQELIRIDLDKRKAFCKSGSVIDYDTMITSAGLPQICRIAGIESKFPQVADLGVSSTHLVGLGIDGSPPEHLGKKCWMYFPEETSPFYRVTHFSHYSHKNVPDIRKTWSLMAEVSETKYKAVEEDRVVNSVIQGALRTGLIDSTSSIKHVYYSRHADTYPIPTVERDEITSPVLEFLADHSVFSRGRMGAWKYEVGNMDHSFMQGKECVDHILTGSQEQTLHCPHVVNKQK